MIFTVLPTPLQAMWILVLKPPRDRPERFGLGRTALCSCSVLMSPNNRGIQQRNAQVGILEFVRGLQNARLAPAIETLKDTVPVAETLGQVAPGSACFGDPHDGVDEQAIVLGMGARVAFFAGQKVTDRVPLFVGDFMTSRHGSQASCQMRMESPPMAAALHRSAAPARPATTPWNRLHEIYRN